MSQSYENISVLCMELTKDGGFLNDSIHGDESFIIVFEDDVSVIDNWEDFHRNITEIASFYDFNLLCRMVFRERVFETFLTFKVAAQCAGMGGLGPEVPMLWDAVRGLSIIFPNVDLFGHDNIICDDLWYWVFIEWNDKCLSWLNEWITYDCT